MRIKTSLFHIFFTATWASTSYGVLPAKVKSYFNTHHQNCFLLKKIGGKKIEVFGDSQCHSRSPPYSTFKILNSLIALETGVIGNETLIRWDGKKKFFKSWERNHNLASAIKYSVVPFYQDVARRIGKKQMKTYIDRVAYGNRSIGSVIDRFWLDGPIEISAYEQLNFIERLYQLKLPFIKEHQKFVQRILIQDELSNANRIFSGKTGSDYEKGKFIFGWFVGHVRKGKDEYIFVANSNGRGETGSRMKKISNFILTDLGI